MAATTIPALVASGADKLDAGPAPFVAYVRAGSTMPAWRRDIATAFNQIPRWAYGLVALTTFYVSYKSYQAWKHSKRGGSAGASTS